jgi:predicted transcriptional regulator
VNTRKVKDMTTEDRLRNYILSKYKSLREFSQKIDMPYSTINTIMKRGIDNSSVNNIIRICQALNISTDDLVNGKIVPVMEDRSGTVRIEDIMEETKLKLLNADQLTIGDRPADETDITAILNSFEIVLEMQKKRMIK